MFCPALSRRSARRPGFTLLEMILVVAILAMIAALATPAIRNLLDSETLRQAGEQVRARWGHARLEAMKTGRIHVFVYEPGGEKFRLDVWTAGDEALEAAAPLDLPGQAVDKAAANVAASGLVSNTQVGDEERLPEGLLFVGSATLDARAESLEAQAASLNGSRASGSVDRSWSEPIFFYPDGTASTAELYIADRNQKLIRLDLRGLTGIARVQESPELEEGTP